MADALHSANNVVLAELKRTQTTNQSPPSLQNYPTPKGINDVVLGDIIDYSQTNSSHSFVSSNTLEKVSQEGYADQVFALTAIKHEEELQAKCLEKCLHRVLDETEVIRNEKLDDEDGMKGNSEERRRKRRGGKGKRNKENFLNFFNTVERNVKKGLMYSREELEAMRFVDFEEQKKKWAEVYCGLGTSVMHDYDRLVDCHENMYQQEHVVDFDPRPKFHKVSNLGEGCSQFVDNHSKSLNTSDPASCLPESDEIGSLLLEEECSQQDIDSDEDYSSIQKPAFLVKGEPDFDSGPPQDGLEFLRRVRWEAAQIPKVKVAKVGKTKEQSGPYMPQIPDIEKCPNNLLPLKEWEDSFLADFSELRLRISQLDGSSSDNLEPVHKDDMLAQMFESMTSENIDNITLSTQNSCSPKPLEIGGVVSEYPTLSAILKMDPASRNSMLKKQISVAENLNTLQRKACSWIFALCAAVDCPLDADTCAALRSLLRKCASLLAAKTELDVEAIMLNILVTLSGRFFGQSDK